MDHNNEKKLIPDFQFGFRNKLSTMHLLALFTNQIANNLNINNVTTACLLDFQAAFDTIWHRGMIFKLIHFNFPTLTIKLIDSFLKNRTFSVGRDDVKSDTLSTPAGSPQGSVLSPIIWNLYIAHLPTNENIKILQFADDTILYLSHKDPSSAQYLFNNYLKQLFEWFKNWKLKLNENKTQLIHFIGQKNDVNKNIKYKIKNVYNNYMINNLRINPQYDVKYLGVNFNNRFTFTKHIKAILSKMDARSYQLNKFIKSNFIDPSFKTLVYRQYIRPITQYACPIWANNSLISSH